VVGVFVGLNTRIGRVKWFNSEQGFGFLVLDDGRDAYLPYTALSSELQKLIEKDLWEGVPVECEIDETEHGLRARAIQVRNATGGDIHIVKGGV
jgi:CspA family cold shock protein